MKFPCFSSLCGYCTARYLTNKNTVLTARFAKTTSDFKFKLNSLSLYTSGNTGSHFQMSVGLLSKTVCFYTEHFKRSTQTDAPELLGYRHVKDFGEDTLTLKRKTTTLAEQLLTCLGF